MLTIVGDRIEVTLPSVALAISFAERTAKESGGNAMSLMCNRRPC